MLGWNLIAGAFAALAAARAISRRGGTAEGLRWLALAVVVLAFAFSQLTWPVEPDILAASGSLLARTILPLSAAWRRAVEPVAWLLVAAVFVAAGRASNRAARTAMLAAGWSIVGVLLLSSIERCGAVHEWLAARELGGAPRRAEQALSFLFANLVLLAGLLQARRPGAAKTLRAPFLRLMIGAAVLVGASVGVASIRPQGPRPPLVGTHVYSWFPENWHAGFVGEDLVPPVLPQLGRYESDGPNVFSAQLAWMKKAGVNLIAFDWWAKRTGLRKRIEKNIQQLGENDPWFVIQYEPHDMKNPQESLPGEEENTVIMTPDRREQLVTHWKHLAKRFFKHPRYLRIDGRPVLLFYASRHVVGDLAEAIAAARAAVKAEIGVEPFVVADEVYFNVLDFSDSRGVYLLPAGAPNWERLAAFDAITCYNAFDSSRPQDGGSAGARQYLSDVSDLYRRYEEIGAVLGIELYPGVLPGYNDRGVRPAANHFVFPRFLEGPSEKPTDGTAFFRAGLETVVRPFLPLRHPMFFVTSWNEWNEGSAIEPSTVSPPSLEDRSGPARMLTAGEWHSGYGESELDALAAFVHTLPAHEP